jgi:HK97 family phage major capsid protein
MDPDLEKLVGQLAREWASFKTDSSKSISDLRAQLRDLETRANRPSRGGLSADGGQNTSAADLVKAVVDFARVGDRSGLQSKAMSIGSSADGGLEVPTELDAELQTVAAAYSPLLSLCKVKSGATDAYAQNVATSLPASAWIAETGTRSVTASPNLAQVAFTRGGVYAAVQATQWVLQDADHDLFQFLISEIGRQFGAAIGTAITTGDGTAKPKGLTAQTTAATADGSRAFGTVEHIATGGATTAPTLDHCITAMSKLHPAYLQSASWLMSREAAAALMTQKASTGGSYLWQPDLSASQPPTLFGKPVFIDPTLPAATTGNALSVWLGDWKRAYTVVRYGRPIMVRDDVTVKGQVIIYSEQRVGGNVTDTSALKCIKTATS